MPVLTYPNVIKLLYLGEKIQLWLFQLLQSKEREGRPQTEKLEREEEYHRKSKGNIIIYSCHFPEFLDLFL